MQIFRPEKFYYLLIGGGISQFAELLHLGYTPIQSIYSPSAETEESGEVCCTLKNSREFGNTR